MTSTVHTNPTTTNGRVGADVAGSGSSTRQARQSTHDRRRLAIGGGVLVAALAIGAVVQSGGDTSVSAVTPSIDLRVAAVPATIFPYLDDGGGAVIAPEARAEVVESERPLLLDGEAFAKALADAAAATEGGQLINGDDLARSIEQ